MNRLGSGLPRDLCDVCDVSRFTIQCVIVEQWLGDTVQNVAVRTTGFRNVTVAPVMQKYSAEPGQDIRIFRMWSVRSQDAVPIRTSYKNVGYSKRNPAPAVVRQTPRNITPTIWTRELLLGCAGIAILSAMFLKPSSCGFSNKHSPPRSRIRIEQLRLTHNPSLFPRVLRPQSYCPQLPRHAPRCLRWIRYPIDKKNVKRKMVVG